MVRVSAACDDRAGRSAVPAADVTLNGLSAPALTWLAGTGTVALVALYLVGRGRRRIIVPFVSLWVPAMPDRLVWAWARRLRRWLSLMLQLAILGCVLGAAGDPSCVSRPAAEHAVVFLLDRSASMAAADESGTRMEAARSLARGLIDGLGTNDSARVLSFATRPWVVSDWDKDHTRLKAHVESVTATDEPGRLEDALFFTTDLLRGRSRARIIIIGDGGGPPIENPALVAALKGIDVRFAAVGRPRDNIGLVGFSARRIPADPTSVELVAVAQSFRATGTEVHLVITTANGAVPVARRTMRLEPGARKVTVLRDVGAGDGRFEARLDGATDALPRDDHAATTVAPLSRWSVLVVGQRNLYLEGALVGMGNQLSVAHVSAEALASSRARWEDFDVVIFDGVSPHPAPQTGHFLYLDPSGAGSPWPVRGNVVDPIVTDVIGDHPLIKELSLVDLNVASARRLTLGAGDRAIAAAAGVPLLVVRERSGLRSIAIAFDIRRSDLPLRSAFPLLIANSLSWLNRPATGDAPAFATEDTVNVIAPAESDLTLRPSLRIDGQIVPPPERTPPTSRRHFGQAALMIALVLVCMEWLTFHRRMTV